MAVKGLGITSCAKCEHLSTHGHHGLYTATKQLCSYAAEGIICCAHSALACGKHCQPHTAVLQHLCQRPGGHRITLACVVFKFQDPLSTMAIEVQHVDGTARIAQTLSQGSKR